MDTAQKPVAIYTTPTCHFCHAAKEFFKEKGVTYSEYDVSRDVEKRQEMLDMTGQMGVPVIHIQDDIVIGFDKPKVAQLLGIEE